MTAGYAYGSNLTCQNAAVMQTPNNYKGKRKPGKDVNHYTKERPLKKAHKSRMYITVDWTMF